MRILVTGGTGQLGSDVVVVLRGNHEVLAADRSQLDLTDLALLEKVIEGFKPAVVLNCAAFTRVDDCETERDLAFAVNVTGPKHLALCVQKFGGKLIHISTDYVFDGRRRVPDSYTEDDKPGPISYYGQTKLAGERAIIERTERHVIVRTGWLYGATGRNFLKTILRIALQEDTQREIRVVNDQFGSLTWSYRLAQQIACLITADSQGIYHATAEGYASWYEVAATFLRLMGVPHNLSPCTSEQYPTPALRPRNSILENHRLKSEGIDLMRPWKEDLEQFTTLFHDRLLRGM
jgi:dTDP-4-dehydrorhamnose reductase